MRDRRMTFGVVVGILLLAASFVPTAFAQQTATSQPGGQAVQRAEYQEKLQQVVTDKAGFVAAIVQRWEGSARELGRWDENFASDFSAALMKLQPDNLITMSEATSFPEVMRVLATGRRFPSMQPDGQASGEAFALSAGQSILPDALGSSTVDLVYTPVPPCRIVDTRVAGGAIAGGAIRPFDVDNTASNVFQGGVAASCGIPFGVASAVAMTITETGASAFGWFTAYSLCATQPLAATLTYMPFDTIANTTIVPVCPGGGNDLNVFSSVPAHLIVDVVGYYAAPVATALDCQITANTTLAVVAGGQANLAALSCPAGYTPTTTNCESSSWDMPFVFFSAETGVCSAKNNGAGSATLRANRTCCRIPGR